jgi:hypothetical protein
MVTKSGEQEPLNRHIAPPVKHSAKIDHFHHQASEDLEEDVMYQTTPVLQIFGGFAVLG